MECAGEGFWQATQLFPVDKKIQEVNKEGILTIIHLPKHLILFYCCSDMTNVISRSLSKSISVIVTKSS